MERTADAFRGDLGLAALNVRDLEGCRRAKNEKRKSAGVHPGVVTNGLDVGEY
jgi:hypothetical protein